MLVPEQGAIPLARFALIPSCPAWKHLEVGNFSTPGGMGASPHSHFLFFFQIKRIFKIWGGGIATPVRPRFRSRALRTHPNPRLPHGVGSQRQKLCSTRVRAQPRTAAPCRSALNEAINACHVRLLLSSRLSQGKEAARAEEGFVLVGLH